MSRNVPYVAVSLMPVLDPVMRLPAKVKVTGELEPSTTKPVMVQFAKVFSTNVAYPFEAGMKPATPAATLASWR